MFSLARPFPSVGVLLDQVFDDLHQPLNRAASRAHRGTSLPANLYHDDHRVAVAIEAPGRQADDFTLEVIDNRLVVDVAAAANPEASDDHRYQRRERRAAAQRQHVSLPYPVAVDQAEAQYRDGILTVSLPRRADDAPRQIPVA